MTTQKTTKEIAFDEIVHTFRALDFGDPEIMDMNIGAMALSVQRARLKSAITKNDPAFLDIRGKASQNLSWFKDYNGTPKEWGQACAKDHRLFFSKPGDVQKIFERNLAWLEEHQVGFEVWKQACLRDPKLFLEDPEKIRTLFEANLAHFADYGMTGERWAAFCAMNTIRFTDKPEPFRNVFELAMVLSKTPYHISTETSGNYEANRVDWFLKMPRRSEISQEGLLLRLAYLEIVKPAPTVAMMTKNTGYFQEKIFEALDAPSTEARGEARKGRSSKQGLSNQWTETLAAYTVQICADARAKWGDGQPSMPQPALISVLAPENAGLETPSEKNLLLKRLALAGLVKA